MESKRKLQERLTTYCHDLPWCSFSEDELGKVITDFVWRKEAYYRRWAQKWFENFQFVYGNHDVKWVRSFGFAVDVDFLSRKQNRTAKQSKTNISRLVAETLSAAIYARKPKWDVSPASDSATQTKSLASMTQDMLDYLMTVQKNHDRFSVAANSFVVYGKVAAVTRWNPAAGIIKWVPKWRRVRKPLMTTGMKEDPILGGVIETEIQALDSYGQPMFDTTWEPAINPDGSVATQPEPQGSTETLILTPFEYRYEEGKSIDDTKWIEWIRLIDYDDWLREYRNVEGRTKYYERVLPEMNAARVHQFAIRQFFRMFYVSPEFDAKQIDMSTSGAYLRNKVLIIEHYDRPDPVLWPKGRRVIVANGECTHITVPDYSLNTVDGWHPFSESVWFNVAPSSMPASAMNDVVQKNKELNTADSLILTALNRNCGSMLLVKAGAGLDQSRITGNPGEIHPVQDLDAARWLRDEQPISPVVNQLRQNIKDDVYEGSGAQDSLRGERSKNVSAGYALRQLQEREERRIAPARDRFESFIANIGAKCFACFRQNVQTLGDEVMGYLKRSAAGEFAADEAITFLTRNIELGVDIKVEPGSMQVESKATKQFNLLDLAQKTAFGQKLASDPKVQDDFLKEFGAEAFRGYAGAHIDRAAGENELFTDMLRLGPDRLGQGLPVVMFEDDDNVHIQEHTDFLVRNATDMMRNQVTLMYFLTHVEQHRIQLKTKQGEIDPQAASLTMMSQAAARREQINPQSIQADAQQRKLMPPPQPEGGAGGPPQGGPQQPPPQPKPPAQGGQNGQQAAVSGQPNANVSS